MHPPPSFILGPRRARKMSGPSLTWSGYQALGPRPISYAVFDAGDRDFSGLIVFTCGQHRPLPQPIRPPTFPGGSVFKSREFPFRDCREVRFPPPPCLCQPHPTSRFFEDMCAGSCIQRPLFFPPRLPPLGVMSRSGVHPRLMGY